MLKQIGGRMGHPDEDEWRQEAAMTEWFNNQLKARTREPTIIFLGTFGDAIQERVDACVAQASNLRAAGFPGASLVRSTAGIEVAIRFFLVKPLVLGAFLSDEWANALTNTLLNGRTAKDRELLPAILRNWGLDVTTLLLSDGSQLWESIRKRVWKQRNSYVHEAATVSDDHAALAIECLERLLSDVVDPMARELDFTRGETGRWSIVLSHLNRELNQPTEYDAASPFPDATV